MLISELGGEFGAVSLNLAHAGYLDKRLRTFFVWKVQKSFCMPLC